MKSVDSHLSTFTELCQAMSILGECSPRGTDAVSSLGERMSVGVLAAAIRNAGIPAEAVDAKDVIETDENFSDAHPNMAASKAKAAMNVMPLIEDGTVPVITGFLGATKNGATTTLRSSAVYRLGSTTTGSINARCINTRQDVKQPQRQSTAPPTQ